MHKILFSNVTTCIYKIVLRIHSLRESEYKLEDLKNDNSTFARTSVHFCTCARTLFTYNLH